MGDTGILRSKGKLHRREKCTEKAAEKRNKINFEIQVASGKLAKFLSTLKRAG
jgi:hypothetical protein